MTRFLLSVALPLYLVVAGCRRQPANARVDPAIAPLVPVDTAILTGLRLDRLKDTPFFKTYVQGRKLPQLEEFRKRTGLDPANDMWEIVGAWSPVRSLVFVRGKFGGEFGLEPRFDVPGLERSNYKGYYLLRTKNEGVLFFNTGVAVAGRVADVQAVVDERDKPGGPSELVGTVTKLPVCHAWVVARGGFRLPEGVPRQLAEFGTVRVHADLASGVSLRAEADYPDTAAARQVQDAIRGVVGLARLRTPDSQPDLLKLYDAITVEARDRKVTVNILAPFELIQSLPATFSNLGWRPPDSSSPRPR